MCSVSVTCKSTMGHLPQEDACWFIFPSFCAGCREAILLHDTVHLVREGRETEGGGQGWDECAEGQINFVISSCLKSG